MGSRTVQSGSVSNSKNDPSRSLQMIERPLMTPDELKSLSKGTFIVTKTGFYPIKVKLKLFFEWGIEFEKTPYEVPLRDNSSIKYASKDRLTESIKAKYHTEQVRRERGEDDSSNSIFVEEAMSERNQIRVREAAGKLHVEKRQDGESS